MIPLKIAIPRKVDIVSRIILYFALGLFIAASVEKSLLPSKKYILSQLKQEPRQANTTVRPFLVTVEGTDYEVNPLYSYELYGLVVSQHDTSSWWDYYHQRWGDVLNLKDVCVIWGNNLKDETYRRMRFRNGSWTCYISVNAATADQDWSRFDMNALSNNHLLSTTPKINSVLRGLGVGDQIYFKGYLASYTNLKNNIARGTSVSRADEGNGACETVYLADFRILRKANLIWRFLYGFSKLLLFGSIVFLIYIRIVKPLGQ